jgi:OmpA-OmpF porin, OOP family
MRNILLILLLVSYFKTSSQNLVLNPSFEQYNNLPCFSTNDLQDFRFRVDHWTLPTGGTSDILSTLVDTICSMYALSTNNLLGPQNPRTGNVMGGIITYNDYNIGSQTALTGYREYLEVGLTEPLVVGERYYVEFWVSRAENQFFASNNIGAYLSDTFVSIQTINNSVNYGVLPIIPQVNETNLILDSVGWHKVSGSFVAQSPAQFIVIGNFFTNQNTTTSITTQFDTTSCCLEAYRRAYYFIDDVSVTLDNNNPTSIENYNVNSYGIELYPNPVLNELVINTEIDIKQIEIYDFNGKLLMTIYGKTRNIDMSDLTIGVYLIKLKTSESVIIKKLIKE